MLSFRLDYFGNLCRATCSPISAFARCKNSVLLVVERSIKNGLYQQNLFRNTMRLRYPARVQKSVKFCIIERVRFHV